MSYIAFRALAPAGEVRRHPIYTFPPLYAAFSAARWNDVIILPRRTQRNTPLHFAKKCCTVPAPVLHLLYFYIFHAFSIIIFAIIF